MKPVKNLLPVLILFGVTSCSMPMPSISVPDFYSGTDITDCGATTPPDYWYSEHTSSIKEPVLIEDPKVLVVKGDMTKNMTNTFASAGLFSEETDVYEYYCKDNALYVDLQRFNIETMSTFDEFILCDVDIKNIPHYADFVSSLVTCVSTLGKTFHCYGKTFFETNETDVSVNSYYDLLPIAFGGDNFYNNKAVVLNIDVSDSMSGVRLERAKEGATECWHSLNPNDYFGLVSFSGQAYLNHDLSLASDSTIGQDINAMDVMVGTHMRKGLSLSKTLLDRADTAYKYCVTLSDGKPFETEEELLQVVTAMHNNGIICSFINIENPSGQGLLTDLASAGGGSYYFCDAGGLPSTMSDLFNGAEKDIVGGTEEYSVLCKKQDDPIMENVDSSSFGYITGFYNYSEKEGATTVLSVQHDETDESPLLTYWKKGKGTVCSFSSNFDAWTRGFRSSPNTKRMFGNLWHATLPYSF